MPRGAYLPGRTARVFRAPPQVWADADDRVHNDGVPGKLNTVVNRLLVAYAARSIDIPDPEPNPDRRTGPDVTTTRATPDPAPARVVDIGNGLNRLTFTPGLTTAAELADALAQIPDGAILMGGAVRTDTGEFEFEEHPGRLR